jgi:hypothetical protein
VNDGVATRVAIAIALSAAALRLAPLGWLHPLNWDEIEFYRATRWIAEGRVPFRDFWEHHSPLAWFVFAPFSRLSDTPGAAAILGMRWAQIPVWIATFWLANVFMRNAGLSRFARWCAMAIALCSSFLMIAAVEYRIDPLACALYVGGLVLWQGGGRPVRPAGETPAPLLFGAGVMFCLTGLTNMRVGPLLVVTVLLLWWKSRARGTWIVAGGIAALVPALLYFTVTRSWGPLVQHLLTENIHGDRYAQPVVGQFLHRLIVVFGVRMIGSDRLFDIAAVDAGGIALLVLGFAGLVIALQRWRTRDDLFVIAVLQVVNLIVVAGMNFIYNYHFELVAILMLPLVALAIQQFGTSVPRSLGSSGASGTFPRGTEEPRNRGTILAILLLAWSVNAFASLFRGKELDLAYQDFVMREVHARTRPGERVWAGMGWALRREPAYRFWFLPDMTRQLVEHGEAAPYRLADVVRDPPALVVCDHYAMVWLSLVQRELAPFFVRHYVPVWRNLWVPGMNARLRPLGSFEWIVPRDGTYRVFASAELARHPWFRDPFYVGAYETARQMNTAFALQNPLSPPPLSWWIERKPVAIGREIALRKGQRIAVMSAASEPLGIVLLSGTDTMLFRQPPPGATLEASTTRVTHVPRFGVRIQP